MKLRPALTLLALAATATLLFLPADVSAAPLQGLDETCLHSELKGCTVMASGYLTPEFGTRIAFQTQSGFTDEDGVKDGVVLFEEGESGWTMLASDFNGYGYDLPRLAKGEQTMLHVPGYTGGTGAYNTDLLLVYGDTGAANYVERWQRIDLDTWRNNIHALLPEGLEIWKGVDYDFGDWFYGELNARTPLWRADDGNCCPSGGWATIHFTIESGVLIATGLDYLPPAKSK